MSSYSSKWIIQRVTALLLIPLTFWFVYNCILFTKIEYIELINFFNSYLNSFLFLIMMSSMLIHAKLGCEAIIDDYISSSLQKKITKSIISITFYLAIFITVISILSILNK